MGRDCHRNFGPISPGPIFSENIGLGPCSKILVQVFVCLAATKKDSTDYVASYPSYPRVEVHDLK